MFARLLRFNQYTSSVDLAVSLRAANSAASAILHHSNRCEFSSMQDDLREDRDSQNGAAEPNPISNVVPWRRRAAGSAALPDADDSRIIVLFDLNGTLTSHTSKRRSAGVNRMRPNLAHLLRLQGLFRLGIFSSASERTVNTVIPMINAAAGQPVFSDKQLILTRSATQQAPRHHIQNGGNSWDTVKPLARRFQQLHRVVLVDDDAFKACPGEELNMLVLPRWDERDDDDVIPRLVDALLLMLGPLDAAADVRPLMQHLTAAVNNIPILSVA